jgi:hypothetical protein
MSAPPREIFAALPSNDPVVEITVTGHSTRALGCFRLLRDRLSAASASGVAKV